ncbi:MAG: hypothetical protein KF729_20060 [Sandaracinaceae bacterium]|nr:hypothetical protein [Sandaracinaceae bacterium]
MLVRMGMFARGLLAAALLYACGGTQTQSTTGGGLEEAPPPRAAGPANARGDTEARATVGRAGGTFSLANGARLEIPSGALARDLEVSFGVGADGQAFGDREHQRAVGPMLNVEPALDSEGPPFVLSIPQLPIPNGWSDSDLAFAMEEVHDEQRAIDTLGTVTRWQFYSASVEGGRIVARTTGLMGHRVQFGVAR